MSKLRHRESWYSRTKKELEEMDYKEKYEKALEWMKSVYSTMQGSDKEDAEHYFPELKESEDERITRAINNMLPFIPDDAYSNNGVTKEGVLNWLEKQKEASKAIEAVERIDKYIDEHLANAHDMKDSNPDKKYYRGWDDALAKMSGILQDVYSVEKQKEQKPEWSEEDERKLEKCIKIVERWEEDYDIAYSPYSNLLKSLRPSWKPSEEQMEALQRAVNKLAQSDANNSVRLSIMYDNLKKLM